MVKVMIGNQAIGYYEFDSVDEALFMARDFISNSIGSLPMDFSIFEHPEIEKHTIYDEIELSSVQGWFNRSVPHQ